MQEEKQSCFTDSLLHSAESSAGSGYICSAMVMVIGDVTYHTNAATADAAKTKCYHNV